MTVRKYQRRSTTRASHSPYWFIRQDKIDKMGETIFSNSACPSKARAASRHQRGREDKIGEKTWNSHSPHALQMLLPASSRRQRGVVLVPQLKQLRAPTAARPRPVLDIAELSPGGTLFFASLLTPVVIPISDCEGSEGSAKSSSRLWSTLL